MTRGQLLPRRGEGAFAGELLAGPDQGQHARIVKRDLGSGTAFYSRSRGLASGVVLRGREGQERVICRGEGDGVTPDRGHRRARRLAPLLVM